MIVVDNKPYRIKGSELDYIADGIAKWVENKVREQKFIMEEKEYLKLLTTYTSIFKRRTINDIFDLL